MLVVEAETGKLIGDLHIKIVPGVGRIGTRVQYREPMFRVTPGTACRTRTYDEYLFGMQPHATLSLRSCSDNIKAIIPYRAKA